ncbi:polyketide synthase [Teredinibacter sp. KSP-S5-2]|uniref:type I polyketide synthase n=1 Tax=Teredinibacter sp. KSP-S5-2 TaxID=3034506 RepID=UPI00293432EF|nr:polyketide synthase [Teredinibacter sp. KSP-S5-2]WNO11458.1 beta-ketoacyl synthase N-terminal-like domain-containing protein [Teredinibacter sp. KSP-S5-2]
MTSQVNELDIAIIGMSGRFPGAETPDQLWENVISGVESVRSLTKEELLNAGISEAQLQDKNYIRSGAPLEDCDMFDPEFFNLTELEAQILDPQRRIFSEVCWEALESAGINPEKSDHCIGVYAGLGINMYLLNNLLTRQDVLSRAGDLQILHGNDKDYGPSHISYLLNLKGPAVSVQTACSSSLVAIHMARQAILTGECDVALAGGSSLNNPNYGGYIYQDGGILSKDGQCRPFDSEATGTVFGGGSGVVVLKRLEEALDDGDNILAVIKGSAINNDGSDKVGFAAPSISGQKEVIEQALASANIEPETIDYIEAHGTGTNLGDPIEIDAQSQIFDSRYFSEAYKNKKCYLGSLKANVGHLNAAAGVSGLIKTVKALQAKKIPQQINFTELNENIDLNNTPFSITKENIPWETEGHPRRAGVSSFGVGGTNAHIVLEEAPEVRPERSTNRLKIFPISAKNDKSLDTLAGKIQKFCSEKVLMGESFSSDNIAFTLQTGRKEFKQRAVVVASSLHELARKLENNDGAQMVYGRADDIAPKIAFMFSGQGSQYLDMAKGLYLMLPDFRRSIDYCLQQFSSHIGENLNELLMADEETFDINQTLYSQPFLFSVEYSLAKQLIDWNIEPDAMIGHSIGEYVAATLAGVFSLEDAITVVSARSKLMQNLPSGSMMAVGTDLITVEKYLPHDCSIAAVNAPEKVVVAGESKIIKALEKVLSANDISCRILQTSHAYHSHMLDPILEEFAGVFARVSLNSPKRRFISNVTGSWAEAERVTAAGYWVKHLRQSVLFFDGISKLNDDSYYYLELGPGNTLSTFAREAGISSSHIANCIRHPKEKKDDLENLLAAVAKYWTCGGELSWQTINESLGVSVDCRKIPLPTYAFNRHRVWIDSGVRPESFDLLNTKLPDMEDWFSIPSWKRTSDIELKPSSGRNILVIGDQLRLANKMCPVLSQNNRVVLVQPAYQYKKHSSDLYSLYSANPEHLEMLFNEFKNSGWQPDLIVHFGLCSKHKNYDEGIGFFNAIQQNGFYSLLYLIQKMANFNYSHQIDLIAVGNGIHEVTGEDTIYPEKATVSGLFKVVQQEYTNINCRVVDTDIPEVLPADSTLKNIVFSLPVVRKAASNTHPVMRWITTLVKEILSRHSNSTVSYRQGQRWIQGYEKAYLENTGIAQQRVKPGSTVLVTGGFLGLGMELTRHLVRKYKARLILLESAALPPEHLWNEWLAQHEGTDLPMEQSSFPRIMRETISLRKEGADILVLGTDTSSYAETKKSIERGEQIMGPISGILHAAGAYALNRSVFIRDANMYNSEYNFRSIAHSMYLLDMLFSERDLDFRLCLGSLGSILGGFGYNSYAGASAYMSALAAKRRKTSRPWQMQAWDSLDIEWQVEDLNVSDEFKDIMNNIIDRALPIALTLEEGLESFDRLFGIDDVSQVVISATDINERLNYWVKQDSLGKELDVVVESERTSRPDIGTRYVEPRNQVEQKIARMWEETFGISGIGAFDNFYELGGNSLMATQLMSYIKKSLDVDLPLNVLFESPTVAALAEAFTNEKLKDMNQDEKRELVAELEAEV